MQTHQSIKRKDGYMKLDFKKMSMYTGWNEPKYNYGVPEFVYYCTDGVPWEFGRLYVFLFED
jgi:hypothetical protein